MNKFDELLKCFCSTDYLRPWMCQPMTFGEMTYAANANAAIRMPAALAQTYEPYEGKTESIFLKIWPESNCEIPISLAEIETALSKFEMIDLFEGCDRCHGDGEIECACCGSISECRTCDGTGSSDTVIGKGYKFLQVVEIGGQYFGGEIFELLLKACKAFESDAIMLSNHDSTCLFKVRHADVILSGRVITGNDIQIIHLGKQAV